MCDKEHTMEVSASKDHIVLSFDGEPGQIELQESELRYILSILDEHLQYKVNTYIGGLPGKFIIIFTFCLRSRNTDLIILRNTFNKLTYCHDLSDFNFHSALGCYYILRLSPIWRFLLRCSMCEGESLCLLTEAATRLYPCQTSVSACCS